MRRGRRRRGRRKPGRSRRVGARGCVDRVRRRYVQGAPAVNAEAARHAADRQGGRRIAEAAPQPARADHGQCGCKALAAIQCVGTVKGKQARGWARRTHGAELYRAAPMHRQHRLPPAGMRVRDRQYIAARGIVDPHIRVPAGPQQSTAARLPQPAEAIKERPAPAPVREPSPRVGRDPGRPYPGVEPPRALPVGVKVRVHPIGRPGLPGARHVVPGAVVVQIIPCLRVRVAVADPGAGLVVPQLCQGAVAISVPGVPRVGSQVAFQVVVRRVRRIEGGGLPGQELEADVGAAVVEVCRATQNRYLVRRAVQVNAQQGSGRQPDLVRTGLHHHGGAHPVRQFVVAQAAQRPQLLPSVFKRNQLGPPLHR